jgi:hypothetical protein
VKSPVTPLEGGQYVRTVNTGQTVGNTRSIIICLKKERILKIWLQAKNVGQLQYFELSARI